MPSSSRAARSLTAAALAAVLAGCATNAAAGPEASPAATRTAAAAPSAAPGPAPSPSSSSPATAPPPAEEAADPSPTPTSVPEPTAAPPEAGTAMAALATLPVRGRAPRTGYDRELFGQAWSDVDRNGCDTRNDVLRRDLARVVLDARTDGCVVLTGVLPDPYTGTSIDFVRGVDTSSDVQVDHVVALSDAWQKGAQQWDDATREAFANDPLNLLAVDGPMNSAKGDGDAATWLPPQRSVRCAYVARQVAVKAEYGAWVTAAERDAVARVLGDCPDEELPSAEGVGTPPPGGGADVVGVAEREPSPVPEPAVPESGTALPRAGDVDPQFGTCGAALDAGYGEYVRGVDAEYDWYRDGDRDGVVCEG